MFSKLKYGLPYMGAKKAIAKDIVDIILKYHPETTKVYDLFGGGGAITFEFAKRGINVVYNEIDTAVVNLLKKLFEVELDKYGNLPKEFYKWISREEFKERVNQTDWFSGMVHVCWSFGNNKNSYVYSKSREKDKLIYHNECIKFDRNIQKERLKIIKIKYNDERVEHLERLKYLENIVKFPFKDKIKLENRDFYSFLDEINNSKENMVVYLDPPYQNTAKYNHDEEKLFKKIQDFIDKCNKPVFLSEYNNHYGLIEIWNKEKRVTLNALDNSKKSIEKLFYKKGCK